MNGISDRFCTWKRITLWSPESGLLIKVTIDLYFLLKTFESKVGTIIKNKNKMEKITFIVTLDL